LNKKSFLIYVNHFILFKK